VFGELSQVGDLSTGGRPLRPRSQIIEKLASEPTRKARENRQA